MAEKPNFFSVSGERRFVTWVLILLLRLQCFGSNPRDHPAVHPQMCQEHSANHGLQQDRQVRRLGITDPWSRTLFQILEGPSATIFTNHQPLSPSCIHWIHVYWSRFLSILSSFYYCWVGRSHQELKRLWEVMSQKWLKKTITDSSWFYFVLPVGSMTSCAHLFVYIEVL